MKPAIEINSLSKKYKYGESQPYYTLRDILTDVAKTPFRCFYKNYQTEYLKRGEFWALKDISFKVNQGEVVGIIGPNGAGKSTLLKILCRITTPTSGEAILRGRVGSLLEVGTGFNQELTGKENIYLNGAILGMTRREINKKFDEIVDFSGVEKFLDTPVKHYSSGMYMRLAFAVAAHLDTDILIVDEVLAVGDAEFQKKCLNKMDTVSKGEGRTILLVSHNMDIIKNLCTKTLLFNDGQLIKHGNTKEVIYYYTKVKNVIFTKRIWKNIKLSPGNDFVRLLEVQVHNENNEAVNVFNIQNKIGITMIYRVLEDGHTFTHGFNLFNDQGINILNSHDIFSPLRLVSRKKGIYSSSVWIPGNFLSEGIFIVGVAIFKPKPFEIYLHETNVLSFSITDLPSSGSARGDYIGGFPGIVRPILEWETRSGNT